jgi:hypothetical protein
MKKSERKKETNNRIKPIPKVFESPFLFGNDF